MSNLEIGCLLFFCGTLGLILLNLETILQDIDTLF